MGDRIGIVLPSRPEGPESAESIRQVENRVRGLGAANVSLVSLSPVGPDDPQIGKLWEVGIDLLRRDTCWVILLGVDGDLPRSLLEKCPCPVIGPGASFAAPSALLNVVGCVGREGLVAEFRQKGIPVLLRGEGEPELVTGSSDSRYVEYEILDRSRVSEITTRVTVALPNEEKDELRRS